MIAKRTLAGSGIMLVAGLCLTAMPAAAQTDVSKEVSTAANHAGLAAKGADLKAVQMHLHHVVNCLVGPKDSAFDLSAGNPCNGQGNGAIPDTSDAAKKKPLEDALKQAQAGLKETDMAAAQKQATMTQETLSKAAM
jgi:hypothetical protein